MPKKIKIFGSTVEFENQFCDKKIISLKVDSFNIAIAKSNEKFFAFKDECPHNRVKLSTGHCNHYDEIVCPLHNYRFDLKTGLETTSHGLFLKTYRIDISNEGVYLEI